MSRAARLRTLARSDRIAPPARDTSVADQPRILFAGTPAFAVPALQRLQDLGAEIALVLTQPDRPAGRGRRLAQSPVKLAATAMGVRVEQPVRLDDPSILESWGPPSDLAVVVAYGLLLPSWLLAWPRRGCINLHASLLPRWRGAAPIHRAILAGDAETGVSVMQLEKGLDTGPVFAARAIPIAPADTTGDLHDRLAIAGADLMAEVLSGILDGSRQAVAQPSAEASYARKLEKAEARLDWNQNAQLLARQVRAFNPWPVAVACRDDGDRLRVFKAEALPDVGPKTLPGRVVGQGRDGIDIATASGRLRLVEVQPPSGRRMTAAAYLAAHKLDDALFV